MPKYHLTDGAIENAMKWQLHLSYTTTSIGLITHAGLVSGSHRKHARSTPRAKPLARDDFWNTTTLTIPMRSMIYPRDMLTASKCLISCQKMKNILKMRTTTLRGLGAISTGVTSKQLTITSAPVLTDTLPTSAMMGGLVSIKQIIVLYRLKEGAIVYK